jgi:hypothetical protein
MILRRRSLRLKILQDFEAARTSPDWGPYLGLQRVGDNDTIILTISSNP